MTRIPTPNQSADEAIANLFDACDRAPAQLAALLMLATTLASRTEGMTGKEAAIAARLLEGRVDKLVEILAALRMNLATLRIETPEGRG